MKPIFFNPFRAMRAKTPREVLLAQQHDAVLHRIENLRNAEYAVAMAEMLQRRIERIARTLAEPPMLTEGPKP